MILNQSFTIQDRKQAGLLLAGRLEHFKNSNAIVVGVPYGGAVVGYHLAEKLNLFFDVIACKPLSHPADQRKSIGSVSIDQAVIHDEAFDVPSDYIYHKIVRNKNTLKSQEEFYYSGKPRAVKIENAEVIVVGDTVWSADSLVALIRALRNQRPKKIIVAASIVKTDAMSQLVNEVDEIVSLFVEDDVRPDGFYEENTVVGDEDIRDLVLRSFEH